MDRTYSTLEFNSKKSYFERNVKVENGNACWLIKNQEVKTCLNNDSKKPTE